MRKPYRFCSQKILLAIRLGLLIAVGASYMLAGACSAQNEKVMPTEKEAVISASPAPTPSSAPVPTTPPDQTPQPVSTPSFTPQPTQAPAYIGQAVCTANESLNIREDSDKSSAVLGALPAGETADVIAYEDGWAYIHYEGVTGYASRSYLTARHTPDIEVPMGDWAAVLVNPSHLLADGYEVALSNFEGGKVDARILDICTRMFADAAEDGIEFILVDAYRSYDRQNELYEKKVNSYTAKGYTREEAETKAATITARPNTSEHQTGLALDIVTPSYTKRDKGFANTDAFKWLDANAQDYGFTLRYKQDKQDYTMVIYEPWHWRFVGVEAARAMKQSKECFEEYTGAAE